MVSAVDYPKKSGRQPAGDAADAPKKKRRFRLLAALAAPFADMDDRALHKKRKDVPLRNNSKGNMFRPPVAGPAEAPAKKSRRGKD